MLARFVPILRTFAPFAAGAASMPLSTFASYNVGGGALWVGSLTCAGAAVGNIPAVRHNFALVSVAIVAVSLLPLLVEALALRAEKAAEAAEEGGAAAAAAAASGPAADRGSASAL